MKRKLLIILLLSSIYMQDEYLFTVPATSYSDWIYFSFTTHNVVNIQDPDNSLDWDLAFQRKHIRTNGGLSGLGNGAAFVDSVGNLEVGSYTWLDEWQNLNTVPENITWLEDTELNDFYDLTTHTFVQGIKNPALNAWGWFDATYALNPTNYVMFVKCANGQDIVKFWAYDYYDNGAGGNVSIRYQTGYSFECPNLAGDMNGDDSINVIDIVALVTMILSGTIQSDVLCYADYNQDEIVNVLDIIAIVNYIVG
ncbi:MAG: hypothetical protein CMG64_02550 [Candidatus Marinimicrobia bacterium]|nr:hypothetical protein [Candidatus Neomarinimicrobiota bacterium]